MARNFIQREFVERGMVADVAYHDGGGHNPHAHILLTTRTLGPEGFGRCCRCSTGGFGLRQAPPEAGRLFSDLLERRSWRWTGPPIPVSSSSATPSRAMTYDPPKSHRFSTSGSSSTTPFKNKSGAARPRILVRVTRTQKTLAQSRSMAFLARRWNPSTPESGQSATLGVGDVLRLCAG